MASGEARIAGLFVHPIKACSAVALDRVALDAHGPAADRRFMVVDEGARFMTQRELLALAAVGCRLEEPGRLRMQAPGRADLVLPLAGLPGPRRDVLCWAETCEAFDQGDEVAEWLSKHCERPLRLVRLDDEAAVAVDARYAKPPATTSFTDGFPLLVVSEASLRDLNERIGGEASPLPMDRFRPNLVLGDCEPYAEDEWRRVRVHSPSGEFRVELEIVKPCKRCVVTTTDQRTLERGAEPLRTLATYRRAALGSSGRSGVYFGQNAVHRGLGSIAVGDRIEVVERAESPFARR